MADMYCFTDDELEDAKEDEAGGCEAINTAALSGPSSTPSTTSTSSTSPPSSSGSPSSLSESPSSSPDSPASPDSPKSSKFPSPPLCTPGEEATSSTMYHQPSTALNDDLSSQSPPQQLESYTFDSEVQYSGCDGSSVDVAAPPMSETREQQGLVQAGRYLHATFCNNSPGDMNYDEGIDDSQQDNEDDDDMEQGARVDGEESDLGYHLGESQQQQHHQYGEQQSAGESCSSEGTATGYSCASSNNQHYGGNNNEEEEEEDSSSGFGSGGGLSSYDNMSGVSYGSIGEEGGGQVDVGGLNNLILDAGAAGLMLEDDDFGDNVEDDEDLDSPVDRLLRRSDCINSKARENVCISIPSTLHQVMNSPHEVDAVVKLFNKLAQDSTQSVRIELVEQVPQLAVLCHEYPDQLARVMTDHLLPLTLDYVSNTVCQLRKTTQAALLVVLEQRLLSEALVEDVCCKVARLTEQQDRRTDDDRADALALVSRMAPILGRELTLRHFLHRFTALCADPVCQIRKICAANFGEFTSIVGTDTTETVLLPLFVSLCKDNVWEVRKACSESFMEVSASCLPATRHSSLSPIFVDLLGDQSRWVRVSAFQNLGMFVSTFAQPDAMERRTASFEQDCLAHSDGDSRSAPEAPVTTTQQQDDQQHKPLVREVPPPAAPTPLPFLTDTRPHSSPLPAVNLLDQHEGSRHEEQYNSFNYWRLPLPHFDIDAELGDALTSSGTTRSADSAASSSAEQQQSSVAGESATPPTIVQEQSSDEHRTSTATQEQTEQDAQLQPSTSLLNISEEPEPRPTSPRRRRRQEAEQAQFSEDDTSISQQGLQRASEPVAYGDVLAQEEQNTSEDLNNSNDSTDSEDTIIELSTLSEGLLSIEDDDNTSDAFKEGIRKRPDSCDPNNLWLSDLGNNAPSIDSSTAQDISTRAHTQNVVPHNLLEQYLLMTDPRRAETEEKDITRHCAFAMPAVALTLGRDNWPVLRDTYLQLAQNFQWRVRRTLAYSMHEMASILGGEHATADLLPLFKEFTVNEPECVRIGVLENLAQFVRVLPPAQRKAMLPHMKYFFGINDRRHRQEFGRQLAQLLKLYPPADCDEHLKLYCLILLTDNVVYNRQNVYGLISLLIERLGCEGDTCYIVGVCDTLCKRFALDPTWSRRQTFVFAAGRVFADGVVDMKTYCEHMLPQLLALAQDRVPNVRLAVAEVMTKHIIPHAYFCDPRSSEYEIVHEVYSRLQRDKDRDVRYFANSPLSHYDSLYAKDSCTSDEYDSDHMITGDGSAGGEMYSGGDSRIHHYAEAPPYVPHLQRLQQQHYSIVQQNDADPHSSPADSYQVESEEDGSDAHHTSSDQTSVSSPAYLDQETLQSHVEAAVAAAVSAAKTSSSPSAGSCCDQQDELNGGSSSSQLSDASCPQLPPAAVVDTDNYSSSLNHVD